MLNSKYAVLVAGLIALTSCGQPALPLIQPGGSVTTTFEQTHVITTESANSDMTTAAAPSAVTTVTLPLVINSNFASSIFGVETTFITNTELSLLKQSGASWVRRNALLWSSIEPTQGARNWASMANLEQDMITASANGLQMILIVRSTPYWAQKNPISPAGPSCGAVDVGKFSAYGAFLQDAVARYSVAPYNVKFWEIGNEVDVDPSYFPAPEQDSIFGCMGDKNDPYYGGGHYGKMLKAVYPLIKAANADAQVLTAGLLLDHSLAHVNATLCPVGTPGSYDMACFFEGMLQTAGNTGFDGVSFHAYDYYAGAVGKYLNGNWNSAWNTTGPVIIQKSRFLKQFLQAYGIKNKYLINSETALLCGRCATVDPQAQATKARYMAQTYAVAMAEGIRAQVYYDLQGSWNQSHLYSPGSTDPHTAYRVAQHELAGSTYLGDDLSYPGVKIVMARKGSHTVKVMWSTDGQPHTVNLPAVPQTVTDYLGNVIAPSTTISVSLEPVFVE